MKRFTIFCWTASALLASMAHAQTLTQAQQNAKAKAQNVPEIAFDSAPNFLKLPPGEYLGEAVAVATNKEWSAKLGIAQSAAITCVKPSGTVSNLVDSASGIHARHAEYYIRTVRADKKDPLAQLMREQGFPVGERGRLSAAMKKAVETSGLTFVEAIVVDAGEPAAPDLSWRDNPYFKQSLQRPSKTLYGFDGDGHKIAFTMCWSCNSHMSLCECKGGILAPPYVFATKEKEVRLHPNRKA